MSQQIANFQCSTEEDLDVEWVFASGYDPTGRTLEVNVRDRSSAIVKTTLTIGSGLTVTGMSVRAKVAKASMSAWAKTEYSADLVDRTGGAFKRVVPTRFTYDEPGKLVGGVKGSSFQIVMASNQAIVAAVGGVGLQGLKGDKGDKGDTGVPGAGAPSSPDILAIAERDDLLRGLAAAGVPDSPNLILDFVRGVHFASKAAVAASILTLIVAIGGGSAFSRASTATYFDSDGLLKTAAVNVPRIDYDPVTRLPRGLLMERSRTNIAPANSFIPGGNPTPTWVTDATVPAPDGSTGDAVLVSGAWDTTNAAGTRPNIRSEVAGVVAGATYTASVYVRKKAGGASGVRMRAIMPAGDASVVTFSVDDTNPQFASGWYRLTGTFTPTASGSVSLRIGTLSGDDTQFYCWKRGLQVEAGAAASSLIFADTAATTRAADVVNFGPGPWLQQGLGTFLIEVDTGAADTGATWFTLRDGTSNNTISSRTASGFSAQAVIITGGVTQANLFGGAVVANTIRRSVLGYAANDVAASWDGGAVGVDAAATIPTGITALHLGGFGASEGLNGCIRRVLYFPQRLSNAKLQALSDPAWS